MNQNNDFNQFGFDHYEQPPARRPGVAQKFLGPTLGEKLRSPLFAGAALLLTGVAFAAIIISSYPSSEGGTDAIVVKADTFAYKETPENPGGMTIANRDTTVFTGMNNGLAQEPAPVENLLSGPEEAQKLEQFAAQVEEAVEAEEQAVVTLAENASEQVKEMAEDTTAKAEETIALQKIVEAPEPEVQELASVSQQAAEIPAPTKPRIHRAGENPETLEFVRNVLDKKDAKTALAAPSTNNTVAANDVATKAASIKPAAGVGGVDIRPGEHFVQLGSVKSAVGAASEWGKIQDEFGGLLSGVSHRVKSADLGERGTYYRIQAGPMSSDSAKALCDQIKLQKPGGCLVTK